MEELPRPARVLVVEDEPDINDSLVELLQDNGYHAEGVCDGEAALARLHGAGMALPDVIVLDLRLRGMDGWTFRAEQRRDPGLARIPVVAVSGDSSPQAETIDAAAFLPKPLDWKRLLKEIGRVVGEGRTVARAEADAQRERLAGLGRLAAGVAHEINNPLAWVTANLRMLKQRLPEVVEAARPGTDSRLGRDALAELDELVPMVNEALEGAARIAEVVAQVRTLSQPQASTLRPLDVAGAIDAALKLTALQHHDRVTVVRDLQRVPQVLADPTQLSQLFVNLLVNAADAVTSKRSGAGVGTVRVVARRAKGGVEVLITDDGVGIPEAVRRRIFDPFFTTKEVGKGSGLGLFLCHGIVTALGGKLEVESEIGRGTTVRVLLPAADAGADAECGPQEDRAPTLLVVEDEPVLARALARLLGRTFHIELAGSVEAAVSLIEGEDRIDAILCDVHMPHRGGQDLYAVVRQRFPHLESRMVFMAGGALNAQTQAFIDQLAERVLAKPLEHDRLEALLLQLTGQPRAPVRN